MDAGISTWTAWLVFLATLLSVVGLLFAAAVKLYRLTDRVQDSLKYIEDEMKLNGGKTMRDAIRRIEHHLGIDDGHYPEG